MARQTLRTGIAFGPLAVALACLAAAAANAADTEDKAAPAPVPSEVWAKASDKPLSSKEIDALIDAELKAAGVKTAPRTTDEQFLRRVYLDVTGRPPTARQVTDFVKSTDPDKRAKVIDELLDSPEHARHWARYWRNVIGSRLTGNFGQVLSRSFETWMTDQIKQNKSWSDVVTAMLTAEGEIKFQDDGGKGAAYFLAAHMGAESSVEQAAEASRIFLGVQIQCAQCHDHPFDVWKREQLHQLVAYFSRVRTRLVRDTENNNRFVGLELVSSRFGEHRMPDPDNPRRGTTVSPKFLDGKAPEGRFLDDIGRRKALAKQIIDPKNHWFAAAYVNRVWGVLLGQSFYMPVDDLGPQKEAIFGNVLARLAAGFRGSNHDMKALSKVILNTEAYQRQTRVGDSTGDHLLFASVYPSRLSSDALLNAVNVALGPGSGRSGFGGGRPGFGGGRPGFGGFGLDGMIRAEFSFDPSLKPDDIESSVPQALILMNSPLVQDRITARDGNILGKILKDFSKDDEALNALYLQVLSRTPTVGERDKCHAHLKKTRSRSEAFEDILWALLNSTEFQTRR